jgi:hypothetical protein
LSALTKVAVALLVVASLLLSAGVVVFVNKADHYDVTLKQSQDSLTKERASHNDSRAQLNAVNTELLSQSKDANARIDALKKDVADREAQVLDLKNQLAKLDQDKKGAEVAMQNMVKVQEGIQAQLASANQQVTELRGYRDKLVNESHQLNVQLTDSMAKVDALERARRNAEERAAGARAELDDLQSKVKNAGYAIGNLPNRTNRGEQNLEGVVMRVFEAGGKPWASISIGSKDNVEKGTRFNVINNNEFLGYLTIQTAEPTDAAGVLEGPKVDKIKQGDQVKTQLQ